MSKKKDLLIPDILQTVTAIQSQEVAISCQEDTISYATLDERSNQLANYLLAEGIQKGAVVGLCMDLSIDYIVALLGVIKAGGIFMPIGWRTPDKRIADILAISKATIILENSPQQICPQSWWYSAKREQDSADKRKKIDLQNVSSDAPQIALAEDDPIYLFFTSGSTGMPKAIVGRHGSLVHFIRWECDTYNVSKGQTIGAMTPITFDPSLRDILLPLFAGATLSISNQAHIDFAERLNWLIDESIDLIHIVPSIYDKIHEELLAKPSLKDKLKLRYIFFAGEALYAEKAREWKRLLPEETVLVNLYGPTETTLAKFHHALNPADLDRGGIVPLGKALPDTKVFIVDEQMEAVADGTIGEIIIQTPHISHGYLQKELNEGKFITAPVAKELAYRTGDLGRINEQGDLEYHGRLDYQIKINGVRIEIGEIESILLRQPAVKQCCVVFAAPHLIAFLKTENGAVIEELKTHLRAHFPANVVPSQFRVLKDFPLNDNGKIDRGQLLQLATSTKEVSTTEAGAEAFSELEKSIHDVWTAVLKKEQIGLHDNFFEIGGHSLNGLVILSKVHKLFNVRFDVEHFFDNPTISEFAKVVASLTGEEQASEAPTEKAEIPLAPVQSFYPVSNAQKRMYLLNQITGNSSVYNIQGAYIIKGVLEVAAFEKSVHQIVERQESLRTRFFKDETGAILQKIIPTDVFDFVFQNKAISSFDECMDFLGQEFSHPFDLENEALIRMGVIKRSEEEHLLYYCMHHIISDGWSLEILIKDTLTVYQDILTQKATPSLKNLRIQYKDYAVWELEKFKDLADSKSYWMEKLGGELPVLNFPTNYDRPAVQTYPGDSLKITLSADITEGLKSLSKQQQVTYFGSLLAVLYTLIYRYSGQQDIILGSPIANRDYEDLHYQIGLFVNTIALRMQLEPEADFYALLGAVKKMIQQGTQHKHYPFEKVVEDLNLERDLSRNPLFSVLVNYQTQQEELDLNFLENCQVESVVFPQTKSKFDFSIYFSDREESTEVTLIYNTDLFAKEFMQTFLDHFVELARNFIAAPATSLAKINYLTLPEKEKITQSFNKTTALPLRRQSLLTLFSEAVQNHPIKTAAYAAGKSYSYVELNTLANQLSHFLQQEYQVGQKDRVIIHLDRNQWLMVSVLATLKIHAVYIPIEKETPPLLIEKIAKENNCSCIIDEALITTFAAQVDSYSKEEIVLEASQNPIITILYTTGSTGEPKGVIINQNNIVNRLEWMWEAYPFGVDEVCCLKTSISFVDHIWELFGPLLKGVPLVCFDKNSILDIPSFIKTLSDFKVSRILLVPSLLNEMLELSELCKSKLSGLVYWTSSGETLSGLLIHKFYSIFDSRKHKLLNIYGSTEVTADATCFDTSTLFESRSTDLALFKKDIDGAIKKLIAELDQNEKIIASESIERVLSKSKVSNLKNAIGSENYLAYLKKDLLPNVVNISARKYIGHMTGPLPLFVQSLASLVTRLNQNQVKIETSLLATMIEMEVINYFHQTIFQYTDDFYQNHSHQTAGVLGVFTNGGTLSNISALYYALNNCLPPQGDYKGYSVSGLLKGLEHYQYQKAVILGSRWCHYSIEKALKLFGLGKESFVELVLDKGTTQEIKETIVTQIDTLRAEGTLILAVVGIAGTTETGVVEPLQLLGEIAKTKQIYFHVDAAFGGAYLLSEKNRHLIEGIQLADTVTICNHKQLYTPVGTSMCLVKNPGFTLNAEINTKYQARAKSFDLGKYTIEGTRNFNSLIMHGLLKVFGEKGLAEVIDRNHQRSRDFASLIEKQAGFELFFPPHLNIVVYRYLPLALRNKTTFTAEEIDQINAINKTIQERQFERGNTFVSYTVIKDARRGDAEYTVFRTVFLNPYTTPSDLVAVLQEQLDIASELEGSQKAEMVIEEKYQRIEKAALANNYHTSIGKPIANVKIYILDAQMELVPVGVEGMIYVGGENITNGYLNDTVLTSYKFVPNPYNPEELLFRTEDMGKWTEDGNVIYLGRKDNQHKIRGNRINVQYIEEVLMRVIGVEQAVVLFEEQKLTAFLTLETPLDLAVLRTALQDSIPHYMIPNHFVAIKEFPKKSNGKINRAALKPELGIILKDEVQQVLPKNALEQEVYDLWKTLFKEENLSIYDDFFSIGGHSLLLVRLIQSYHKIFAVPLKISDLFVHRTIKSHSALLQSGRQKGLENIAKIPTSSSYPLSSGQQRLMVLHQLGVASAAYHMTARITLAEDVDLVLLSKAIDSVVDRHEILRTVFKEAEDGIMRQWVLSRAEIGFEVDQQDFREMENASDLIDQYISKDFQRAFDLSRGPLLRVSILQEATGRTVFYYNMHHIVSDGWSMDILFRDVLAFYEGYKTGKTPVLPTLNIQYKDYVVWQAKRSKQAEFSLHKAYWMKQLSGNIPLIDFPSQRQRPKVKTYNGKGLQTYISAELTNALHAFVQQRGGSLFTTLMAIWKVLIHKYTLVDDLVVGTAIAGREHADLFDQIGFYVNTIVLRSQLVEEDSFVDFYERVVATSLAAFEHQMYSFDQVVEDLSVRTSPDRNPVFDVMLVLQNTADEKASLDLDLSPEMENDISELKTATAKFDLQITFQELGDFLSFQVNYNSDVYEGEMVENLMRHFKQLAVRLLNHTTAPITTIDFLSDSEKQILLHDLDMPPADYPKDKTIVDLFEAQVAKTPNQIALVFEDERLTYKELDEMSNQLAHYLADTYAVQPDDLIGLQLDRSEWMIVAILGVLKAGGAYVPVDPAYPAERIHFIAKDSDYKVCLDAPELAIFKQNRAAFSSKKISTSLRPENLAYVIYTSGTTGKPKGVMLEHRNVVRLFYTDQALFDFNSSDVWCVFHSYCFDFSVWEIFGALLFGGKLVVIPDMVSKNPFLFTQTLKKEGITVLNQTPSAFKLLQIEILKSPEDFQFRYVIFGGEALFPHFLKEWKKCFPKCQLINMYGITETTVHTTYKEITTTEIKQNTSNIGRPIPTMQCFVLDARLNLLPVGVPGELYVSGAGLARGYLHRPELDKEKFIDNPYQKGQRLYKTGDLCKKLPDGELEYLGRIDDQVKIRGYRVELGEIEYQLQQKEGIKDVVVLAVLANETAAAEKELIAYFVSEKEENNKGLRAFLSAKLPHYMVPAKFVAVEKIPLTFNGKVNKAALPAPYGLEVASGEIYVAPRNETDEKILAIWQKKLGLATIGINDNLFEIGGNSLKVISIVNQINQSFEVELPLDVLLGDFNIRNISDEISKIQWFTSTAEVEAEDNDSEKEFFSI